MLQKRLDYGFNGYQVPFIPRAARSSRRRGPVRKQGDNNRMCAFDLLATVAGKLLLEGESSESKPIVQDGGEDVVMEDQDAQGDRPIVEHCDPGSDRVPSLSLELGLQVQSEHSEHCNVKEIRGPVLGASSTPVSVITSSDCLEKDGSLDMLDLNEDKSELCSHSGKLEGCSPVHMESCLPNLNEYKEQCHGRDDQVVGNRPHMYSSEGPKFLDRKPPALITSGSSGKLSSCKDQYPCGLLSLSRDNNVEVVTRDDDENSSECTQPSTLKTNRSPARIGDRRIRKLLASRYWRAAPKAKDGDLSDTELRYVYRSRKMGYKRQRSQRIYPFKKRRFFHYSSLSNSEGYNGCKGVYNSPRKANDTNPSGFGAVGHGVNGSSSRVVGQTPSFSSRESHVKLRIKSFRVPELFIEMPETATIGSLKRTVMEAVTALLGGGLHVGVLLQGKKIRDDNTTLQQSGISQDGKVGSIGFALEPNPSHASPPVCSEDNSLVLSADVPDPVSRCPAASASHQETCHLSDHPINNLGNLVESDHDSTPFPAEISAEKGTVDSQALVAFPEGTPEALAVVPAHQKCKRSEMAQRRIRRPFSVSEVEALVQAVEKLGTGRWRDVKLRAFDNVKHRTYVDLKDKWKTLVHTAKIAPQQRRGEPVPQELLDRVLNAHGYWSQQQAKQQLKQQPETCLLL